MEVLFTNKLVRSAKTYDIPQGGFKAVNVNGKNVILANVEGRFHAIEDCCAHTGCPLNSGTLKGNVITCSYHSSKFDVTTGKVLSGPANKPLKTYKMTVKDSDLLIEL